MGGIPSNGLRIHQQKLAGYSNGCPDLYIFEPHNGYHGLFIEMKVADRRKGRLSNTQERWLRRLRERGYCARVAFGRHEAKRIIDEYFGIECASVYDGAHAQ